MDAVRESRKFSGYPRIGRIARSSLWYHSFHMKFLTDFTYRNLHGFARFPGDSMALVYYCAYVGVWYFTVSSTVFYASVVFIFPWKYLVVFIVHTCNFYAFAQHSVAPGHRSFFCLSVHPSQNIVNICWKIICRVSPYLHQRQTWTHHVLGLSVQKLRYRWNKLGWKQHFRAC